ncbi:HD-GYP domain-containing protein [Janibacter anophelis]|uniref:HD-GYP domain-containing protein n=1 Tax=Janibacter anophelis TaxID=319054 RepID=UPI000DEF5A1B|nr:HD domain-containing phosphohydrolase [Janibacter anophelis]
MIGALRSRPGLVLFGLAVVIGSVAAVRAHITEAMITPFAIVAVAAIILGEQIPMRISRRVIAPLTTAPALGLILAPLGDTSGEVPSTWTVLAVVWLSILLGGLLARVRGISVVEGSLGSRFIGMAVTTGLARGIVVDGQTLVDWAFDPHLHPAIGAAGLIVAALGGGLAERIVDNLVAVLGGDRRLAHIVAAEVGPIAGISTSTVASGPLIALAKPVLDWAAIPLLLVPVVVTYLSVRRLVTIRQSLDESLLALACLPEVVGLTRSGHVRRVTHLACVIGQEMGLDATGLHEVERTALLHDLGQLGLTEPLRNGATIHSSPEQVDQMVRTAQRIVSGAPQLAPLAPLVGHVGTPFRRSREFGEHIPLPSRIVRVANAWDDITEGTRSPRAHAVALERLHLGLGYDYDPEVVSALERALEL